MQDAVRVLVIDDSDDDRMLYRRTLKQVFGDGLTVTELPTGDAVLQVIASANPSCVLLDYSLPGRNGIELLKLIRLRYPHLPVILMTGLGSDAVAMQSIKEGAQDYLAKVEISPDMLGRVIRLAIEKGALNKRVDEQHAALEISSRDLAEARAAAELANRAKSHFLAGMSHELRTPLSGILGYAELLHAEGNLDATQLMRVEAIRTAGRHLLQMISCVLDLSEMETGRTEVELVECEVGPIAAACFDLIRPAAEAKSLGLAIAVSPDTPTRLMTDPMRLRQVLFNLLCNAAKFTRRGTIELRLRNVANGSMLRFEVIDTGPGISADQRPLLFKEFERLDTASIDEGAGLGLAISTRLAALMGGRLGHDDNPGGGAVFWLELPAPGAVTTISAPRADVTGTQSLPVGTFNVLIADDILMNRDIASSYLIADGHNVICVESGGEAIVAVASIDFDVVLMDVRMPGMDGLEATRRIRALESARARVPIVALTAHAMTEQVAKCREAGMDSHLAKPYTRNELLFAVAYAVRSGRTFCEIPSHNYQPLAAASQVIGADLMILDLSVFDTTASFLSPEAVAEYLQTIADGAETLLCALKPPNALTCSGEQISEAAHTLAGSAGMFGFQRVAALGHCLERAVQIGEPDPPALAGALCAALEATLQTMHDRLQTRLSAIPRSKEADSLVSPHHEARSSNHISDVRSGVIRL